jgi:hypothetical protein
MPIYDISQRWTWTPNSFGIRVHCPKHALLGAIVTNTGPLGSARVLAARPWHTGCTFVSSHAVFLSSFFRFDVLVTIYLYDPLYTGLLIAISESTTAC